MKRYRGFSLLELMIVVSIVAILAAWAISSYQEQVRKSKRSEAMKNLAEYQLLMEKWRASCPSYADDAAATNNCKDRTGDGDAGDPGDATYPTLPAPASNNYTYTIGGQSTTGYTVTATPKSTFSDPKCGNFVVTVAAGVATRTVSTGNNDYCLR